jgi:hypothetical protein
MVGAVIVLGMSFISVVATLPLLTLLIVCQVEGGIFIAHNFRLLEAYLYISVSLEG